MALFCFADLQSSPLFKNAGSIFAHAKNWRNWNRAFGKISFEQL